MTNQKTDKPDFNRKDHWEQVYSEKASTEVSWYQQHPQRSLELIKATGVDVSARIIDIGGGASTLADFILDAGYTNLSVLDISQAAMYGMTVLSFIFSPMTMTDQVMYARCPGHLNPADMQSLLPLILTVQKNVAVSTLCATAPKPCQRFSVRLFNSSKPAQKNMSRRAVLYKILSIADL
jgi:hypothetical protein